MTETYSEQLTRQAGENVNCSKCEYHEHDSDCKDGDCQILMCKCDLEDDSEPIKE